jgi:peptidoglycan/LPS O-acetylase OafA/YrhL
MDNKKFTNKNFRGDINGLRAWAVVAVMLYHFGVSGPSGGFVGVDIFFVISGYLMTGLIISGLEQSDIEKRFSLVDFYLARARRIVPALAVMCAILLTAGWFCLPAIEYRQLGQHVVAALAFISNIKFWREAGYFDVASHEKWLLHTWSLSVEWQFYLLLPLMLLVLWRFWPSRRAMTRWLLAGFVVSLALSMVFTALMPAASFYLLPSRAWEMLAGGLVYMLRGQRTPSATQARWLELAGFALMIGAMILTEPGAHWPGWLALVPVTGAALVLRAARTDSVLTGMPVAQWLGNASYSIYLWHWPVVVSLAYFGALRNHWAVAAGLLTSVMLGYASYAWLRLLCLAGAEQP